MSIANQSEKLTDFYKAYLKWAEDGAPVHNEHHFGRHAGLCSNAFSFGHEGLRDELIQQFVMDGLDEEYPFNENCDDYASEAAKHHNPKRMAWVHEHALET